MFEMEMNPMSTMELTVDPVAAETPKTTNRTGKNPGKAAGEKLAAEMAVFASVAVELRGRMNAFASVEDRCKAVVSMASELFGVAPTWTAFYREILGKTGIVDSHFPESEDRQTYEASDSHSQIFEMLTALRSRDLPENDPTEPQRMITIRLPMTLHNAICDEANDLEVSVNKLCISRMLQQLDDRMIPACKNKRRGRRPGAGPVIKPVLDQAS